VAFNILRISSSCSSIRFIALDIESSSGPSVGAFFVSVICFSALGLTSAYLSFSFSFASLSSSSLILVI